MLNQILMVLNSTAGPLSLDGLSQQLGTEKSALEGMLELLIRKGKIKVSDVGEVGQDEACTGLACAACGSATHCPFIGKMPRVYERVRKP